MGLPSDNNPLFENDNQNINNSNQTSSYFTGTNDPDKVTFKTDTGREMSLNYNKSDINSGGIDKTKQSKNQDDLINIINNERELEKMNNPWLKESYNLAKKFYEADDKLESKDRAELSTIFSNIRNSQILGMQLTMLSILTVPYFIIYRKYGGGGINAFRKGGSNQAGRVALLNFNRKFPRLLVFSFFGMMIGGNIGGKLRYDIECDRLEKQMMSSERKYNQYQLLKMTSALEAFKWSHYYTITSIDPTRRLRNPGELLGSVVGTHNQVQQKESSKEEGEKDKPFQGGVWEKNPFHHVDSEKSENDQFEKTGIRTERGIPISPYSRKYGQREDTTSVDTPNADIPLPEPASVDENGYNADLEDPFFQKKQEEEKKKSRWW